MRALRSEDFTIQQSDLELMDALMEELRTALLKGMPVETRLRGLPPEERLRGLTPEEMADGLTDEQAERLRELLERRRGK
ncbi:MAG: hypothetical protein NTY19_06125 [Planctomycetota bacterium]|nr:hypothetical protein [Planctomycetota bacterium]